ncbi:MAG TPA: hypothetical protein PKN75_05040 [Bacteroidia bacterium]|nr:hypothetical protein [Bacteroidia bacterium]HNU32938.1 hypothetical protein [Bacteroidia bacterium]
MNPVLKNILAIIVGAAVGSLVNMCIIMLSGYIIPPPAGADVTNYEGLKASIHLFGAKHFIFPFLAHALGTLVGAFVTAKLAANNKTRFAMVIGILFLAGGIMNVMMLPAPMWFNVLDILAAYIPMAYLGGRFGAGSKTA